MSDTSKPFAFSQFVPGFDFLKNLSGGAAAGSGAVPGMPSLSSWVAPTLSVEEVEKRIHELKTVQYWLEQNGHALKATIQALEVQKMTLSTLRGMNVRMEDLANAFTRPVSAAAPEPAPAPASAPAPAPMHSPMVDAPSLTDPLAKPAAGPAATEAGGVVDPLQWWGALTQQFQQIATSALHDASQLKMPAVMQPLADAVGSGKGIASGTGRGKPRAAARKKAPADSGAAAASRKSAASTRKPARSR